MLCARAVHKCYAAILGRYWSSNEIEHAHFFNLVELMNHAKIHVDQMHVTT